MLRILAVAALAVASVEGSCDPSGGTYVGDFCGGIAENGFECPFKCTPQEPLDAGKTVICVTPKEWYPGATEGKCVECTVGQEVADACQSVPGQYWDVGCHYRKCEVPKKVADACTNKRGDKMTYDFDTCSCPKRRKRETICPAPQELKQGDVCGGPELFCERRCNAALDLVCVTPKDSVMPAAGVCMRGRGPNFGNGLAETQADVNKCQDKPDQFWELLEGCKYTKCNVLKKDVEACEKGYNFDTCACNVGCERGFFGKGRRCRECPEGSGPKRGTGFGFGTFRQRCRCLRNRKWSGKECVKKN